MPSKTSQKQPGNAPAANHTTKIEEITPANPSKPDPEAAVKDYSLSSAARKYTADAMNEFNEDDLTAFKQIAGESDRILLQVILGMYRHRNEGPDGEDLGKDNVLSGILDEIVTSSAKETEGNISTEPQQSEIPDLR